MEVNDLAYALRSIRLTESLTLSEFNITYSESSLLPICHLVLVMDDFDYFLGFPGMDHYYLYTICIWLGERLERQLGGGMEFSIEPVGIDFYEPRWPKDSKWFNLH